jgi:hypothetical protein
MFKRTAVPPVGSSDHQARQPLNMALDPIEVVSFHCRQAVVLGSAGFAMFLGYAAWLFGSFWASDNFSVWVLSIFLVLAFLALVASPIQFLVRRFPKYIGALVGAISGPFAVVVALAIRSRYSFTFERYIQDFALFHVIFAILGGAHGVMFRNWLMQLGRKSDGSLISSVGSN